MSGVQAGSILAPRMIPGGAMAIPLLGMAGALGWLIASEPGLYRPIFALAIASVLSLAALQWPRAAVLVTLLFLPLLGLLRRLLIPTSGWPDADPLLLIGPIVALVLFTKAYILEPRPLASDLLSKLILAFLAIAVIGVVNPLGGSIEAGLTSLMFTAVPLLWFLVGRAVPDRRTIRQLQYATPFLAFGIALYGLSQTEIGFPAWDLAWLEVGGYPSLYVGEQVRGFGTLASAAEYAFYLAAGMILAFAALLHGRAWPLVLVPVLATGVLVSSVRSVMVLAFLALVVMVGIRANRPQLGLPIMAGGAVVAFLALGPVLANVASSSGSDLISHQLEGITRPFDEDASTLSGHLTLIGEGISEGFSHPLGRGTAVTTHAGPKFGMNQGGTEFDFSNVFVSFGLLGGLLFLATAGLTLVGASRNYLRTRDPLILGALGLAIVTLGWWLNGAHYALTPLIWLILGWATSPEHRSADHG